MIGRRVRGRLPPRSRGKDGAATGSLLRRKSSMQSSEWLYKVPPLAVFGLAFFLLGLTWRHPSPRWLATRASSTNPNSRRMRSAGMSRVQYHSPLWERRSQERGTSTSSLITASMREPCRQATQGPCRIAGQRGEGQGNVAIVGAEEARQG